MTRILAQLAQDDGVSRQEVTVRAIREVAASLKAWCVENGQGHA